MPTVNSTIDSLELRNNNPYSIGNIFVFPEGDFLLDRTPIDVDKSIYDKYHTVIDGDTLGKIAFNEYGNSKEWWVIADVNDLYWPFELTLGDLLLIPDIRKVKIKL